MLPCLERFITLVVFEGEAVRTTIEAVAELALSRSNQESSDEDKEAIQGFHHPRPTTMSIHPGDNLVLIRGFLKDC